jgi:hypothetical protein
MVIGDAKTLIFLVIFIFWGFCGENEALTAMMQMSSSKKMPWALNGK